MMALQVVFCDPTCDCAQPQPKKRPCCLAVLVEAGREKMRPALLGIGHS